VALLDRLDKWRSKRDETVCLVTFNYDLMLELALERLGMTFRDIDSYVEQNTFRLFKLHGSVDCVHPTSFSGEPPNDGSQAVREIPRATVSTEFERGAPGQRDLPAVALPFVAKASFECPSTHQALLAESLPDVDRVLIIGWRGAEKHFLKQFWQENIRELRNLWIVAESRTAAEATAESLPLQLSRLVDMQTLDCGFSGFLNSDDLDILLG
jgi:hypothetical protein